jgi:molybdenum cofactor guanylyltransferase
VSDLLRLEGLRKSFGKRVLLDIGVLEIPQRTCMVLSGRNGAGKTILLKIIAGLEPPDRLDVHYQGQTLPWHLARRSLQRDVIYLHQHPYMFDRSVEDNVAYGLKQAGVTQSATRPKVRQALEWAGLKHLALENARCLSGGEKQRVALARARVLSPRLLLLDEPFANMDLEAREQTLFFILRLKDEGISTIVTTHEPTVAKLFGDLHIHLCKTGPCRFTMVEPFLYERSGKQIPLSARGNLQTMTAPSDSVRPPPSRAEEGPDSDRVPKEEITGAILAGGRGRRMGGEDKGLLKIDGTPLVLRIAAVLQPQVGTLVINANRNLERYREFGYPVIQDIVGEFFGPLVGMASALQAVETPYLLTVPCDSPLLPHDLSARLFHALRRNNAEISVAHDGTRMQPVFTLLRRELLPDLLSYLDSGGRKIDTWYAEHRLALADFSDRTEAFLNLNTPAEWSTLDTRINKE